MCSSAVWRAALGQYAPLPRAGANARHRPKHAATPLPPANPCVRLCVGPELARCVHVQSTYIRLYRYCGNLAHAAMYLRRARVVGRGSTAGAWGDDGKKPRRGPLVALPGEGVWRHAWGDGAHCPSTARHATFNDQIFVESHFKFVNLVNLLWGKLAPPPRSHQISEILI